MNIHDANTADKPVIVAEHHDIDDMGDTVSYGFMEGHDTRGIDTNRVVIYVSNATAAELDELGVLSKKYDKSAVARNKYNAICAKIVDRRSR